MADEGRNRDDEDTRLLEQIEMRLQKIENILSQPNDQLAQIIKLLTPPPSDDVASLKVTIDTPTSQ